MTGKHEYEVWVGENLSTTGEKVYEPYVTRDGAFISWAGDEYPTRLQARRAGQAIVRDHRESDAILALSRPSEPYCWTPRRVGWGRSVSTREVIVEFSKGDRVRVTSDAWLDGGLNARGMNGFVTRETKRGDVSFHPDGHPKPKRVTLSHSAFSLTTSPMLYIQRIRENGYGIVPGDFGPQHATVEVVSTRKGIPVAKDEE